MERHALRDEKREIRGLESRALPFYVRAERPLRNPDNVPDAMLLSLTRHMVRACGGFGSIVVQKNGGWASGYVDEERRGFAVRLSSKLDQNEYLELARRVAERSTLSLIASREGNVSREETNRHVRSVFLEFAKIRGLRPEVFEQDARDVAGTAFRVVDRLGLEIEKPHAKKVLSDALLPQEREAAFVLIGKQLWEQASGRKLDQPPRWIPKIQEAAQQSLTEPTRSEGRQDERKPFEAAQAQVVMAYAASGALRQASVELAQNPPFGAYKDKGESAAQRPIEAGRFEQVQTGWQEGNLAATPKITERLHSRTYTEEPFRPQERREAAVGIHTTPSTERSSGVAPKQKKETFDGRQLETGWQAESAGASMESSVVRMRGERAGKESTAFYAGEIKRIVSELEGMEARAVCFSGSREEQLRFSNDLRAALVAARSADDEEKYRKLVTLLRVLTDPVQNSERSRRRPLSGSWARLSGSQRASFIKRVVQKGANKK